jgi:glucosamine kinase
VAVDGGQSAVRVRLSWADEVLVGPGFSHGERRVGALIAAVVAAVDGVDAREVDVVAMGHTGMPVDEAERSRIAADLAARFGARQVLLAPDMATAHIGALAGEPGVVISAGTGTVALGVGPDGSASRVDGWGYLFGDDGSAFDIGRAAIALAMRHLDGRAEAPELHRLASEHFGTDLSRSTWDLYTEPSVADRVARFAEPVVALAAAGDPDAQRIVGRAVAELAASAAAAAADFGASTPTVSYTGGLFASSEVLQGFRAAVQNALPHARVQPPAGDPLAGATRLARHGTGIHASLVHTYRGIS